MMERAYPAGIRGKGRERTMGDTTEIGRAVAALRYEYAGMGLDEGDVDADPVAQFTRWFEQAN